MTSLPTMTLRRPRAVGILLAMCVLAAACGGTNTLPANELTANAAPPLDADGPQYGDSLDEFLAAKKADAEAESLAVSAASSDFREIQWEDLVPPGFSDEEISARFADRLDAVEAGSPEADVIYEEMQAEYDGDAVNTELDGQAINLAGFVAALTYEGELITEFLLVPYFGACVHVPPPPPNQTVMVTLEDGEGLTFDESWGAIWVTGTLTVTSTTTDLATAGYSISGAQFGVHDEL